MLLRNMFLTNRARHEGIWIIWESLFFSFCAASLARLPDDVSLQSPQLMQSMTGWVVAAVISATIVAIVLRFRLPKEPADERDRLYEALGYKDGFRAIVFLLVLLVSYVISSQIGVPGVNPDILLFTPVNIIFVLFFTIYLGDVVRRLSVLRKHKYGG